MTRRCVSCGRYIPTDGPVRCLPCNRAMIERDVNEIGTAAYLLADTQGDPVVPREPLWTRLARDPLAWLTLIVLLAFGMAAWAWVPVWWAAR